jgi:hypothetical protein
LRMLGHFSWSGRLTLCLLLHLRLTRCEYCSIHNTSYDCILDCM